MDKVTEYYIGYHFSYNPETGIITRMDRVNSNGSYDKDGYLIIKILGKQFKAHRLAWFLFYGEWPKYNIDHINRNRTDNRISNLRDVPQSINVVNSVFKPNKDTGLRGIHISSNTYKKYTVRLKGKTHRFYHLQEAINFRQLNNLPC